MTAPAMGCAVVTHNSADVIRGLLDSVHRLTPAAVAVVDHESSDGTPALLDAWRPPFTTRILHRPNRGYAAGVNAAVAALREEGVDLVALLNPDTRLIDADPVGLRELFASCPRLGSACPLTVTEDGLRIDTLGLRLTPWCAVADHGQGELAAWTGTATIPGVIGPCGGSALYRAEALGSVSGPFDERFFLYFEDADLALRLAADGWSTTTTDLLRVQHGRGGLGGRSGDLSTPGARLAARERQRSFELFVHSTPQLSRSQRLLGVIAARVRGRLIERRMRRALADHG